VEIPVIGNGAFCGKSGHRFLGVFGGALMIAAKAVKAAMAGEARRWRLL
jgi:hypothetical protein